MRVIDDPTEGLIEVLSARADESIECFNCDNFAEKLESVRDEEQPVCKECLRTKLVPVNNGDTWVGIDDGVDDYEDWSYRHDGIAAVKREM